MNEFYVFEASDGRRIALREEEILLTELTNAVLVGFTVCDSRKQAAALTAEFPVSGDEEVEDIAKVRGDILADRSLNYTWLVCRAKLLSGDTYYFSMLTRDFYTFPRAIAIHGWLIDPQSLQVIFGTNDRNEARDAADKFPFVIVGNCPECDGPCRHR